MSVGKHVDFGMADKKGRAIGARIRLYASPFDGIDVEVWPTRDGEVFGREPQRRRVEDFKSAQAEVQRRLTSMIKRYAKTLNLTAEGCHAKWVDRETDCVLTLRDAADYESDPSAGRYFVICEAHGSCVGVETKKIGRATSGLDFCDACRGAP